MTYTAVLAPDGTPEFPTHDPETDESSHAGAGPETTESEAADPEITGPEIATPEITSPGIADPGATDAEATDPEPTESDCAEPDCAEPDCAEADCAEAEATASESAGTRSTGTEATAPDRAASLHVESGRPGAGESDDSPRASEEVGAGKAGSTEVPDPALDPESAENPESAEEPESAEDPESAQGPEPAELPESTQLRDPFADPPRTGGKHRREPEPRSAGRSLTEVGRALRLGANKHHRSRQRPALVSGGVVLAGAAVGAAVFSTLPTNGSPTETRVSEAVHKEPVHPAAGPPGAPPAVRAPEVRTPVAQTPVAQTPVAQPLSRATGDQKGAPQAGAQSAGTQQADNQQVLAQPAAPPAPDPVQQQVDAVAPPTDQLGTWINQALHELVAQGYPLDDIDPDDIRTIIQHESGGDPTAVNNSDSNAAQGTPSKGLMQTIDPTFRTWALPGHRNIYDPVDNIIAGVRYSLTTYGSLSKVPGVSGLRSGGSYRGY